MIDLIIHFLLLGLAIFAVAELMPGIKLKSFSTAIIVGIVYSLVDVTLGKILALLGLPFIVITMGLFLLIINTFLLWLTDKLMDDFDIDNLTTTFIAALIITITNNLLDWLL